MAATIVKINDYLEKVRSEIAKLDIVADCQLYTKQINFNTRKTMALKLVKNKATCFIEMVNATNDNISNEFGRLIMNYTMNIYFIAQNNKSSNAADRAGSVLCNEAQQKVMELLFIEDFDFNIEHPKILSIDIVDDNSEVFTEYSIYYLTYTQKLVIFETKN